FARRPAAYADRGYGLLTFARGWYRPGDLPRIHERLRPLDGGRGPLAAAAVPRGHPGDRRVEETPILTLARPRAQEWTRLSGTTLQRRKPLGPRRGIQAPAHLRPAFDGGARAEDSARDFERSRRR